MNIEVFTATDDHDCRNAIVIHVDGKEVFSAYDGEPEDNTLCRNFNHAYSVAGLMKVAHEAGVVGQSITITEKEVKWSELP